MRVNPLPVGAGLLSPKVTDREYACVGGSFFAERQSIRIILESHAGQAPGAHGAQHVTELEGGLVVGDALRPDVRNAVSIRIGGARVRLPRQVRAHAVGCRQARTLANEN